MTDNNYQQQASALCERMGLPAHGPMSTAIAALAESAHMAGLEAGAVIAEGCALKSSAPIAPLYGVGWHNAIKSVATVIRAAANETKSD